MTFEGKKTRTLTIRVSEQELEAIKAQSKYNNKSQGNYLLDLVKRDILASQSAESTAEKGL